MEVYAFAVNESEQFICFTCIVHIHIPECVISFIKAFVLSCAWLCFYCLMFCVKYISDCDALKWPQLCINVNILYNG